VIGLQNSAASNWLVHPSCPTPISWWSNRLWMNQRGKRVFLTKLWVSKSFSDQFNWPWWGLWRRYTNISQMIKRKRRLCWISEKCLNTYIIMGEARFSKMIEMNLKSFQFLLGQYVNYSSYILSHKGCNITMRTRGAWGYTFQMHNSRFLFLFGFIDCCCDVKEFQLLPRLTFNGQIQTKVPLSVVEGMTSDRRALLYNQRLQE